MDCEFLRKIDQSKCTLNPMHNGETGDKSHIDVYTQQKSIGDEKSICV